MFRCDVYWFSLLFWAETYQTTLSLNSNYFVMLQILIVHPTKVPHMLGQRDYSPWDRVSDFACSACQSWLSGEVLWCRDVISCCAGATFWPKLPFSATAAQGLVARSATRDVGRATFWGKKMLRPFLFAAGEKQIEVLYLKFEKIGPPFRIRRGRILFRPFFYCRTK